MKTALVLAGGGARGAYQVGAYRALLEMGYSFDIITGASVGALNGAMIASGKSELLYKLWDEITTEKVIDCIMDIDEQTLDVERKATKILFKKAMANHCIDQSPLRELIERMLDIDALYDSTVEFGLTTAKYPSFTPVELFKNDIPKELMVDYLMASSACFPAMKPYIVDGCKYVDGGYFDSMPINLAIKAGAKQVIAIDLQSFGAVKKQKDKSIPVKIISPRENLGHMLMFSQARSQRLFKLGYNDTLKVFGVYDGWRFTFKPHAFDALSDAYPELASTLRSIWLPMNSSGDAAEKRILSAAATCMEKATSKETIEKGWLYAAADMAGSAFLLDSTAIYTEDEYIEALLARFDEVCMPSLEGIGYRALLYRLLTTTDERIVIKMLYEEMKNSIQTGDKRLILNTSLIFKLMPKLIIATFMLLIDTVRS